MTVALFIQARGIFGQLFAIYLMLGTVPLGLGTYLLIAPRRAGNFLNDAFALFPHVEPTDTLKKIFYRALGLGFFATSAFYIHQIGLNIVVPLLHFFRSGR